MLDVRRLRLLRDLAHLGTITAVAQAHAYTPSAVSQQLAALQREAGVPLLEHAGRRVGLTAAGAALVRDTEAILAAIEAASATLAAAREGLSGPVRIGAFPTAVRTLLPGALVGLGAAHPALDLTVIELDPTGMPAALREGRVDVALPHDYDIAPVPPDPAVDAVPLLEETVFLAVPPDVSLNGGDPVAAVRHEPWIVGSPGTLCHEVAVRVCRNAGYPVRVRHHADDFTAVLALVAAGQGVALVPQLGAVPAPPGVRLIPLPVRRRTRVAYRRGAGAHPTVAACVSALRDSTAAYLDAVTPPAGPTRPASS